MSLGSLRRIRGAVLDADTSAMIEIQHSGDLRRKAILDKSCARTNLGQARPTGAATWRLRASA
jgi:hypothetical protein